MIFEGDLQFGDKVRLAVGVLRFVDVCSDTGSGSADLIGNDRFVLTFQEFHQIEYLHGKVNGKCTQSAFSHKKFSLCKVTYHRKRKNQGGLPPCKRSAVKGNTILTRAARKLHGQHKLTSSQVKWSDSGMKRVHK